MSHRSGKKAVFRKEKTSQHLSSDHSSLPYGGSQEHLDSGLGSIDSQPTEAPWSDHQYGLTFRSLQHTHNGRQQYYPTRSAPCSCCSHGASSQGSTASFQHQNQHYSLESTSSHSSDMIPYGLPHYASYSAYPVSMSAYSQPTDFQHSRVHSRQYQQQYWSEPLRAPLPAVCSLPGERSQWEPCQGKQPSPSLEEREVVRKKLLAIFSGHLVDTAMDMFPQLMDPQLLVAEILMLQSQNKSLRWGEVRGLSEPTSSSWKTETVVKAKINMSLCIFVLWYPLCYKLYLNAVDLCCIASCLSELDKIRASMKLIQIVS